MLRKLLRSEKGFTLVELMVVILIIGILVAIAIPVYNASRQAARDRTCQANLRTLDGAIETYNADNNVYPSSIDALSPNYVRRIPDCPNDQAPLNATDYSINADKRAECQGNGTLVNFTSGTW